MKQALFAAAAAALIATTPAGAALLPGAKAPDFVTQATLAGAPYRFRLADVKRKGPVVLYFFPAAFTPGCTVEAHEFAEATATFKKYNATVVGMSADPIEKLNDFSVKECSNKFSVGTATPQMIADYDVKLPQREGLTNRTSFVIAPSGEILFSYSAMNPAGHVTGTLDAVKKYADAQRRSGIKKRR